MATSSHIRARIEHDRKSSKGEFWFLFKTWQDVVKRFARRQPIRRELDPKAYELLHHDLLAQCRKMAYGDAKETIREIEELVSPWVSLRSLENLESEHRWKLLESSKKAERALRAPSSKTLGFYLLLFFATACLTVAIMVLLSSNVEFNLDRLEFRARSIMRAIEKTTVAQRFQIAGLVAAVIGIIMVRMQKKY